MLAMKRAPALGTGTPRHPTELAAKSGQASLLLPMSGRRTASPCANTHPWAIQCPTRAEEDEPCSVSLAGGTGGDHERQRSYSQHRIPCACPLNLRVKLLPGNIKFVRTIASGALVVALTLSEKCCLRLRSTSSREHVSEPHPVSNTSNLPHLHHDLIA